MAKVLCTRPNAAEVISGVNFEQTELGMLSEEISDEQAAAFCEIPGYTIEGDTDGNGKVELAELVARATELQIAVKATWKEPRLKAEIERAEAAAAEAAKGKSE